jgi:flagellar hook-basal body complex protein FliE
MSTATAAAPANAAASSTTFDSLVQGLQNLNSQMTVDQHAIESLAIGQGEDLHRVIMNLESTKLQFDLALQVRNKVLDAYQELMRMQI